MEETGEAWQGRAPARSGLARPVKIAKPEHLLIVNEKGRRDAQRRIAQERVPAMSRPTRKEA